MRKRKEQATTPTVMPIQLLTIPEVAKRLRVGRTKVYGLIKYEGLVAVLVGSVMRVSEQSLLKWVQDHERVS